MAELQKVKADVLANGIIGDAQVEAICRQLYPEGKIDKEVVEFLLSLREQARSVCPGFEQFLCDAVKYHLLTNDFIDAKEAAWLRQKLFAHGKVSEREKKLLWDLKHEASGVSAEFEKLYNEYL